MKGESNKKSRFGIVVRPGRNKTAIVSVERRALDKTYKKYMKTAHLFKVHDEKNELATGDRVEILETRPMSREKRWRLQKILVKAASLEG